MVDGVTVIPLSTRAERGVDSGDVRAGTVLRATRWIGVWICGAAFVGPEVGVTQVTSRSALEGGPLTCTWQAAHQLAVGAFATGIGAGVTERAFFVLDLKAAACELTFFVGRGVGATCAAAHTRFAVGVGGAAASRLAGQLGLVVQGIVGHHFEHWVAAFER